MSSPVGGRAESASLRLGSPFLRHAPYCGLLCQLPSRSATCASHTLTWRPWTAPASTSSRASSSGYWARTVRARPTTLEIIEGLRKPDSGHVTVLGLAAWPRNGMLLPRIGVQLQASSFFERLTAREQIRTFASLYGVPAKNADDMLGTVGLTDQAGVRAEKLSGGQAQRLSIACALVHDPELLCFSTSQQERLTRRQGGICGTCCERSATRAGPSLTTHHMDEAESLCDRVAIMDHGKILRAGPASGTVRDLDQPVRISVQSGLITRDEAAKLAGIVTRGG